MTTNPATAEPNPIPLPPSGPVLPPKPAHAAPASTTAKASDLLRQKLDRLMPNRGNSTSANSTTSPPNTEKRSAANGPVAPSTTTAATEGPNEINLYHEQFGGAKSGRVMIIDDEETNILTVEAYLRKEGYREFISTVDSRDAMHELRAHKPDILLLDINMPHVSGIDILRQLSLDSALRHTPTIVLTAATDPEIKQQALELGAADFLTKPVDPLDLIPRVRNALIIKKHIDDMSDQNARLEELVKRRTEDLFNSRQQLILSLARAAEHRDDDTGNHVIRVGRYAGVIAAEIGWSEQRVQMIEQAAQLHDVGKIGIPDSILFKPGKLDPCEWELMRQHCTIGAEIIEPIGGKELEQLRSHVRLGAEILHMRSSPMMMMATRIAQTHHERWDGSGYPLGLAGEDIPIEGRITAVADVFDALSSARPYKSAFPREKCFEILQEGRASHFDPTILDAFFARSDEIVNAQLDLMDRKS